ncbi:MAG: hypothetical protein KF847_19780 [Pirellulales bacterium]|nr:hypothetical protein [Pirellulales bacterium]
MDDAGPCDTSRPDVIVLWQPYPTEHAQACALGWMDCGMLEYARRLVATTDDLRRQGHTVVHVRTTIDEILAVIGELGLEDSSDSRAAACGLIHARRVAGDA